MKKEEKHILEIIKATPLVSIDLIIKNPQKKVLLGKRVNRPARGYWFVPGGRILKNETIKQAFKRIAEREVGNDLSGEVPHLLGAYEHIYEDNFLNAAGINTHYVVLAFVITLQHDIEVKPDKQHSDLKWWEIDKLLVEPTVHQNTKAYFR
ncbi:MAG: GDP-mannose mannosyl hydrolase [Deltaproteobacteria bacterium]|jgi:colanic acid biosynthesis protein WcaH|nr:GDP-mannose mannosyl hydrolase [Deltaproteobacteria bacterium]